MYSKFLLIIGLALLCSKPACARAPRYIDDAELSLSPVIVVAQWERAPFTPHFKERDDEMLGKVVVASEAYTTLRVLRIVKGSALAPGEHDLLIGGGIAWTEDGEWVTSGTSTELIGDAKNITKPRLWFLHQARSWDESRPEEYLAISNYRSIQPLALEQYYLAMGSNNAMERVPRLLSPDRPVEARRILRHLSGGIWPWPYDPDKISAIYSNPESRRPLHKEHAEAVWALVGSATGKLRPYALSVYAELAGRDGIERVRSVLHDKDPQVRGTAIGILARHRDLSSVHRFAEAARGVDDGSLACKVVTELVDWGIEDLVPALISFLQNSQFAYQMGDDLGIPAIKARQGLHKVTGHWFPFDRTRSAHAWSEAIRLQDPEERLRRLQELIPGAELPLIAELVGKPVPREQDEPDSFRDLTVTVRIRNISTQPVTVLREPTQVSSDWPAGSSTHYHGGGVPDGGITAETFATLAPREQSEFKIPLSSKFLRADPAKRRLTISYTHNGNDLGIKAWIGALPVGRSTEWTEERTIKHVEDRWPNGNLKAVGDTVNGHRMGEWQFFNEQGDRIKIAHYGDGRGTATCNPEHPDNKGAGKRPPSQPAR